MVLKSRKICVCTDVRVRGRVRRGAYGRGRYVPRLGAGGRGRTFPTRLLGRAAIWRSARVGYGQTGCVDSCAPCAIGFALSSPAWIAGPTVEGRSQVRNPLRGARVLNPRERRNNELACRLLSIPSPQAPSR